MTALRTIVGVCNKYVKVIKKKLTVKRHWSHVYHYRTCRAGPGRNKGNKDDDNNNYYENEAVDNMINELIDFRKTDASVPSTAWGPTR